MQNLNSVEWQENNDRKDLSNSDKFSAAQLKAMHFVAKVRAAADSCGAGFVGGFISPTGERFMMSNMEDGDPKIEIINRKLDQMQNEVVNGNNNSVTPAPQNMPTGYSELDPMLQKLLKDFES